MPAQSKANYPAREKGAEAGGLERDPTLELRRTSAVPTPVYGAQKVNPGDQWVPREEVRRPIFRVGFTLPTNYVMADSQVPGHHDIIARVPVPHAGEVGRIRTVEPRINRAYPDRPWDYGSQVGGEQLGNLAAPPVVPDREPAGWRW